MSNILNESDILVALNFVTNNAIIDIDDLIKQAPIPSAEKMLIKKDGYQKLSKEAKEMIEIIINGPSEVINILSTPIRKTITIKNVKSFFTSYFSSTFIAEKTIEEIQNWVSQL